MNRVSLIIFLGALCPFQQKSPSSSTYSSLLLPWKEKRNKFLTDVRLKTMYALHLPQFSFEPNQSFLLHDWCIHRWKDCHIYVISSHQHHIKKSNVHKHSEQKLRLNVLFKTSTWLGLERKKEKTCYEMHVSSEWELSWINRYACAMHRKHKIFQRSEKILL